MKYILAYLCVVGLILRPSATADKGGKNKTIMTFSLFQKRVENFAKILRSRVYCIQTT